MGTPALQWKPEKSVEERLAKLETHIEHIQSDVSDIKTELRRLSDKIDAVVQGISDLRIGRAADRVWWLLMSAALLGIMARAFKWI
jgi:hypothetical protein